MDNQQPESASSKKLIVLIALIVVLGALLIPQLASKTKSKARSRSVTAPVSAEVRASAEALGVDLTKGPPLPMNFEKMPPKLQELILKSRARMAQRAQPAV